VAEGSTQDDFELDDSPETSVPETAPNAPLAPEAPKHDALVLAMAQELGIDNADALTPEALKSTVLAVRRQQAKSVPAPEVAPPEPDEAIDWGRKADGTPRTEAEAVAEYDPLVVAAHRRAHQAMLEAKKLAKRNDELQARLDRQEAERQQRQLDRQLKQLCSERPDLFGDKPGQAKPGTPEHQRYQLLLTHLGTLVAQKQHTTLEADARSAFELFGPAPKKAGSRTPTVADYARGSLARPSNRRPVEAGSYLQRRIAAKQAELEELAETNGVPLAVGGDDDDADLLD